VQDVKVVTSIETLTDTCTIQIPAKYRKRAGAKDILELIKAGQRVKVELGYNNELARVFTGYVAAVARKDDYERGLLSKRYIEIRCESNSWRLKQKDKEKGFEAVYIHKLTVKKFVDDYIKVIPDAKDWDFSNLPDYGIASSNIDATGSVAQALDFLGRKHNLYFFFDHDTFYAITSRSGFDKKDKKTVTFKTGSTIIDNTLKLREGAFTAFGAPLVRKGDRVIIEDAAGDEAANSQAKKTDYLVKGVTYKFGPEGYRQEVSFVSDLGNNTNLAALLRKIVSEKEVVAFPGRVTEVNGSTCDVKPDDDKLAPLVNVRLTATEEAESQGWRVIPKKDSRVLVAKISHSDAYVAMFSEIERVEITATDTIMFNGGDNGGLVKIKELEDNLHRLKSFVESIHDALPSAFDAVGASSSANGLNGMASYAKAMSGKSINFTDMENPNITH
jgi:hypothetical protein